MTTYEGTCIVCKSEITIDLEKDQDVCPNCGHTGWWEEKYTEDNFWWVWYWDPLR